MTTKKNAGSVAKKVATSTKKVVRKTAAKAKKVLQEVEQEVAKIEKKTVQKLKTVKATAPALAAKKEVSKKSPVKKSVATKKIVAEKKESVVTKKNLTKAQDNAQKITPSKESVNASFNPEYLVLMQKDPNWMHAFWEVSEERLKAATKGKAKVVIRLFDVSKDLTVRKNKKKALKDIVVPADARSWYVESPATVSCAAVLGTLSGKNFTPILEAKPVQTLDLNSKDMNPENPFVKASLGGASLGNFMSSGFTSQTAKSWLENLRLGSSSESMFSGALSSGALNSNEVLVNPESVSYGKDFFLWVKTRLIVYGGTKPDAKLQVRGEPFPLNPDGTFSFEQDLPDSTQVIPVFATDKDGDFPTTIVPIVVKRTE